MTNDELDDWIIQKTDTKIIVDMMDDNCSLIGVGRFFYVHMLVGDYGYDLAEANNAVCRSLVRLLRAGKIYAVGINAWSTKDTTTNPQRRLDAEAVRLGKRPYTADLRIM
jgi:hypothetical protein